MSQCPICGSHFVTAWGHRCITRWPMWGRPADEKGTEQ